MEIKFDNVVCKTNKKNINMKILSKSVITIIDDFDNIQILNLINNYKKYSGSIIIDDLVINKKATKSPSKRMGFFVSCCCYYRMSILSVRKPATSS